MMNRALKIQFQVAVSAADFELGKRLFRTYAEGLGFDLSFQQFDQELEQVDQMYSPPEGMLLIVNAEEEVAIGCFGLRPLEAGICELKRMYLHANYRGMGIGRKMMEEAFRQARKIGYEKMRLDTLDRMKPAIALYENYGFYEIPSYRYNPMTGVLYFEKVL